MALEKMSNAAENDDMSPGKRKGKAEEKRKGASKGGAAFGNNEPPESKDVAIVRFSKDYNKERLDKLAKDSKPLHDASTIADAGGYKFSSESMPTQPIPFYQVLGDNSLMEMFNGKLKFCLPYLSLI